MLERFTEEQLEVIKSCAEMIRSVENGTANQRNINVLFGTIYFSNDPDDEWEVNMKSAEFVRNENSEGNYYKLAEMVSDKFPEMNKAYLPFMIGDILREVYEVKENV
ncbi:MAG: hypothetical protein NC548_51665 [Lachnospiraceae bacterium]|nr:hypothetical protein [Lachnospiraceae bacterium]MCM1231663.1 hypothetical protein [Ruminococcus flavefaciens]